MIQNSGCRIKQANNLIGFIIVRTIVRTQIRKKFKFTGMTMSVSRARSSFAK